MGVTDHAFMLGQYTLAVPLWIDPAVLGVPVAPVTIAMMVAGAMSTGGLLEAKWHAQMLAVGAKMA